MLKFVDLIGVGGKYRYLALVAAGLLGIGAFILTHPTPGAQASADAEETGSPCSDPVVTKTVSDIIKKKIFSGQGGGMFDEGRFGGRLTNIVTEEEKPLTCAGDFRPVLAYNKLFLAEVKANPKADAAAAEKELADKLTTRLTWTVKRTAAGGVYVQVIDGLETFN